MREIKISLRFFLTKKREKFYISLFKKSELLLCLSLPVKGKASAPLLPYRSPGDFPPFKGKKKEEKCEVFLCWEEGS